MPRFHRVDPKACDGISRSQPPRKRCCQGRQPAWQETAASRWRDLIRAIRSALRPAEAPEWPGASSRRPACAGGYRLNDTFSGRNKASCGTKMMKIVKARVIRKKGTVA